MTASNNEGFHSLLINDFSCLNFENYSRKKNKNKLSYTYKKALSIYQKRFNFLEYTNNLGPQLIIIILLYFILTVYSKFNTYIFSNILVFVSLVNIYIS